MNNLSRAPQGATVEGNDPFGLRRYSLRRYSVRHMLMLVLLSLILFALTVSAAVSSQWALMGLSATGTALVVTVFALMARMVKRRVVVEQWIRRLGMGDFDYTVPAWGNDELSKCCLALETLRLNSIEAMRLNQVRALSQELQSKNEDLVRTLGNLRRTQDQVVARRKLAELGDLSAGVAHEMANPINLARNFVEASEDLLCELSEEINPALEHLPMGAPAIVEALLGDLAANNRRALQSMERATAVVDGMLSLASNTGRSFQETDIGHLVGYYGSVVGQSWVERQPDDAPKVEMVVSADAQTPSVSVVPQEMARVVTNTVKNGIQAAAARAMSEPGHRPAVLVSVWAQDDICSIEVTDNGAGISPENLPKIFDPFFTTRAPNEGTGLGLTVCHEIIRGHGGDIKVESQVGTGTTVTVTFPVHGAATETMEPALGYNEIVERA